MHNLAASGFSRGPLCLHIYTDLTRVCMIVKKIFSRNVAGAHSVGSSRYKCKILGFRPEIGDIDDLKKI